MQKYHVAEIVELGEARNLVLGLSGDPIDFPGAPEPNLQMVATALDTDSYEAAEIVELGTARELVLGIEGVPSDAAGGPTSLQLLATAVDVDE